MTPIAKFLIGGAATTLLAWGNHAATGQKYVASIGANAAAALSDAGIGGVESGMRGDGGLNRTVVLSGDVSPEKRAAAEAALAKVSGIGSVVWASDIAGEFSAASDGTDGAGGPRDPAVTACQSGIDKAVADKTINFRSGSAYMANSSLAISGEVAEALKACEGLHVLVGGHTDAAGADDVNQRMSQARADAVAAALTERGVAADRITATGFGENKLKVPGDGANPANRRIEFTVTKGAAGAATSGEGAPGFGDDALAETEGEE